jgi:hypothetical protein
MWNEAACQLCCNARKDPTKREREREGAGREREGGRACVVTPQFDARKKSHAFPPPSPPPISMLAFFLYLSAAFAAPTMTFWKDCCNSTCAFQVDTVTMTPNPVQVGQNVSAVVTGTLSTLRRLH